MGSAEDSSKEINSGGAIMTIEKELAITFGYITERFNKLFHFIDWFDFVSAAEGLAKCNFSNVTKKSASRMMKQWSKDVKKYFKSYEEKPFIDDSNIKLPDQFDKSIKGFSKRLDDFYNTDVNPYLENIQTELQYHQNNKSVSQCLTMIEDALIRKQGYLKEFIKYINEKYSEQSSVSESNISK